MGKRHQDILVRNATDEHRHSENETRRQVDQEKDNDDGDREEELGPEYLADDAWRPAPLEIFDTTVQASSSEPFQEYHLTGERQYVEALKRAGDWLVEAQGDEVPLWADQYDADNNPAWAREFEPPAYGTTATQVAVQALREVYRFSGDDAYVEAIRRTLAWLEENCPEGKLSCFTEPGTGRAIAGWGRKVYYLDNADDVAYLKTQPMGSGYTKQIEIVAGVRRMLEQAEAGPPGPSVVTQESALASLPSLRNSATSALDTQHESGVWLVPKVANYMGSLGRGFGATCSD